MKATGRCCRSRNSNSIKAAKKVAHNYKTIATMQNLNKASQI